MTDHKGAEGKVLFITGASMGIGAAVARHAVQAGYRVVLTARSLDRLEVLAAELGQEKALALKVDVTEWTELEAAVQATLERFGRLDAAFANAGFTAGTGRYASGDPTPNEWRDMILTNVLGAALTARATLPEIVKARGHFFLVGSVAGRVANPGPYSATKWAISGMGDSIRKEVSGQGVRVTIVEPGRVDTEFWRNGRPDAAFLHEDDVARAVLYALTQPEHVAINELLIRPTTQDV
ncbi:SDR family oxidoreductase [Deinococcus aquiradiocola]|uniref:Short-chain dehydrogenase n=1 Tax=Deinococcus aquiradiocola TaxID=393059 RepID=A0A917PDX6_9DEIO|nr:SDR family oxidoreductase [Deinococcus aquiradiocola]GGJ72335.1 short-chain dehydrogenase [Deinococcus aquiradiocola]